MTLVLVLVAFSALVLFGLSRWAHIVRSRPLDGDQAATPRPGGG